MPKTSKPTTEQVVADAMRKVAVKLIDAIDAKYINRSSIDGETMYETLMAVADELDPEFTKPAKQAKAKRPAAPSWR